MELATRHMVYMGRRTTTGDKLSHVWRRVDEDGEWWTKGKNTAPTSQIGSVWKFIDNGEGKLYVRGEHAPTFVEVCSDPEVELWVGLDEIARTRDRMLRQARQAEKDGASLVDMCHPLMGVMRTIRGRHDRAAFMARVMTTLERA